MQLTEHTLSLADFREKADETLSRINETGEAEVLTVDGETRAVLLSPAAHNAMANELQLSRDVAPIKKSLEQIERGECQELHAAFADIRAELLAKIQK
jgi:PHD/YefM family antitoxin component YafN of YafNO toxin-antitoxin module